jgi:phenylacetate-coenzyme A ligase PaaK-like adenylate-forming protein
MSVVGFESASTRFEVPPQEWASNFVKRVEAWPIVSRDSVTDWFRSHSEFYSTRLRQVHRWSDVPVMEKADLIRADPNPACSMLFCATTSGTTGEKVTVAYSPNEAGFKWALMYRPFAHFELPCFTRQAIFLDVNGFVKRRIDYVVADRTYERIVVPSHYSTEVQMRALEEYRPHVLRGFPSAIYRLAVEIGSRRLRNLDLRLVSPSGEWLRPEWRSAIEASFRSPVCDRYGATEVGPLAWQCPFCLEYHANADEQILETTPEGDLLVTPLFLTTQPLLRYRLGDSLRIEEPRGCRIRLPIVRLLGARADDWLIDGDGHMVSPLSFNFEHYAFVEAWRVHQLRSGVVVVYCRAGRIPPLNVQKEIRLHVEIVVPGRTVEVRWSTTEVPSVGKYKRVKSDLGAEQTL